MKLVPRAGVEPARVAPLVFETSASTDSAIWAYASCVLYAIIGAKVNVKIILTKISRPYFAGRWQRCSGKEAGKRLHLGASFCSIKDAHGLEGALTLNKEGNEE